ncbi:hypothetical protein RIF29_27709 [Crotalaria pallida]|uniref:Vacuolar protein-sorting-associated protein 36 n=1 Tax=Crotalaria pallida TaxID=3830 RepID=A0AAN9I2L5_CROPI
MTNGEPTHTAISPHGPAQCLHWVVEGSVVGENHGCHNDIRIDFVKVPLERAGGIINLIDIYCLFNRARGTELISPDDLLQACSLWEKFDVPVVLRKFDSGVMVIQTKSHSDEEVISKIKMLVMKPDALRPGISARDAARTLGVAQQWQRSISCLLRARSERSRDLCLMGKGKPSSWVELQACSTKFKLEIMVESRLISVLQS